MQLYDKENFLCTYSEKSLFYFHDVHQKSHRDWPEIEPGLSRRGAADYSPLEGTALPGESGVALVA